MDTNEADMKPEELRDILKQLGLGQKSFAAWLGHGETTGAHWCRVAVPGSIATLARLLRARPELLEVVAQLNGRPVPYLRPPGRPSKAARDKSP